MSAGGPAYFSLAEAQKSAKEFKIGEVKVRRCKLFVFGATNGRSDICLSLFTRIILILYASCSEIPNSITHTGVVHE